MVVRGLYGRTDEKDKAVILYEIWDSDDHHKKYVKFREKDGHFKAIGDILREPLDFAYNTF